MRKKLIIAGMFSCVVVLCSCGAQKKLETANSEIGQLKEANNTLQTKNSSLQNEVSTLMKGNQTVNAEFSAYKNECEKTKKELALLEQGLDDMNKSLVAVMTTLQEGMQDFKDKGVEVYRKDGVIYVSLQDALLYKSGSAVLGAEGKKALGSLASALNDYPNLKVIVVGNTDTMHVKGKADNWSLSTERANGVVRILRDDYKVDPARLTSAGKGKYDPVADNGTVEGRAQNRRTEIILNPDMRKIWDAAEKK